MSRQPSPANLLVGRLRRSRLSPAVVTNTGDKRCAHTSLGPAGSGHSPRVAHQSTHSPKFDLSRRRVSGERLLRARPRARSISWWSSASSSTPSGTSAASISASVRPSQLGVAQSRVAGSMETAGSGETLDAGALLEVRVGLGMGASGSRLPRDGADRRAACTEAPPAISRLGASAISWLGQMAIAPLGRAPATHGGGSRDGLAPLRGPSCESEGRRGRGRALGREGCAGSCVPFAPCAMS